MEGIRQIGMLLCAVSLLSMLVEFLLPKAGVTAAVKAAAGIFFTGAMVFSLMQIRVDTVFDFSSLRQVKQTQLERTAKKQTLSLAEHAVADRIFADLKQAGYAAEDVFVQLHILPDNGIEINKVEIQCCAKDAAAVVQYVKQQYGIVPRVEIINEEG